MGWLYLAWRGINADTTVYNKKEKRDHWTKRDVGGINRRLMLALRYLFRQRKREPYF